MIDKSVLSKSYFTSDKIVRHHVDSFNSFLEFGLQKVIDEQKLIETDIEGTHVRLNKIRIGHPVVREADGAIDKLYPTEARLRNITYAAPLHLGMTIVSAEGEKEEKEASIGLLPIMKGSKICNLVDLSDSDMVKLGEDPQDPGGYFIVNGTERVITTLEDLAPNKIMVEFEDRYGDKIEVAKVFSQRRGYRALVVVERSRKSLLEVSFPSISGRINFITLMRALGIESDEDIVNAVSDNPDVIMFMLENLEEAEVSNKEEAMEKIGIRVASGQGKEYQVKRANYVIDRYLMPHLGNDEAHRLLKAQFLGRMAQACFELALGKRTPADKDHYSSKRLKLAGDLMEDLFRVSFNRLIRDIKYQLERASMRNRDLNVSTVVRADVLTERLVHPLATGNWVGGRTGVSQLLDRTDYIASLSHLRRVISPLSRSQPHFEARDLHPTQWGRVCPSETPEGPNCGLVKNFAQLVEISTSAGNETQMKNLVYEMGTEPVDPHLIGMEETVTTYVTELEAIEEDQAMKIEHEEEEDAGIGGDSFE